MPRTDEQNEAILAWARDVAAFASTVGDLAVMVSAEVKRLDDELGELRDDLQAIARRQSSTDRVLQARTEHLA